MVDGPGGVAGSPAEKQGGITFGKVAAGCLLLLLLGCVLGGVAVWKLMGYGQGVVAAMQEIRGVPGSDTAALLAEAARKAPWEEPGAPEASAERIETFFRVRATSQAAAEGARKSWEVFDTEQDLGFWGQAQEGLKAYEIWAATRQAFGRALVDEGMSADEYRYLHRLLFHSGLVEGSISGDPIPLEGLEEVPEEARVVVTGFAEKIQAAPSGSADGFLMGLGSEAFQVPDKGTPGSK